MTDIQRIAVVGGGFMGGGIAQVAAQGGFEVTLIDVNPAALDKAIADMRDSLGRLCAKGVVKEPAEAVLSRVATGSAIADAARADVVIEA
ncbi:MAG: hypothetical protein RLZZ303_3217, partial [Candidatus Hydrogenedentota bacterium]